MASTRAVASLQALSTSAPEERKKKPPGEVIRYTREFLMKFAQVRRTARRLQPVSAAMWPIDGVCSRWLCCDLCSSVHLDGSGS